MIEITTNSKQLQNIDRPFTEILSLLRHEENLGGYSTLGYETQDLKIMYRHIDNAIDVLLRGIQDLGSLLSLALESNEDVMSIISSLGLFIAAIGNLTEALNNLRIDADDELKQRGELC